MDYMPFGENAYYFFQKYITRSLRNSDEKYLKLFEPKVIRNIKAIYEYGNIRLKDSVILEFGAGWDLYCPIGISGIGGVRRYICVDINRFVHKKDIIECIDWYKRKNSELENMLMQEIEGFQDNNKCKDIQIGKGDVLDILKQYFHIDYMAPCDMATSGLDTDSVDYIIVNTTLQHIPFQQLDAILGECSRILKRGGLFVTNVNYLDHYANFDKSITHYNFLQYTDSEFEKYNPPLHYQNRLRHSDYLKLFKKYGFCILEEQKYKSKEGDKKDLSSVTLSEKYMSYSDKDLLILGCCFVLKNGGINEG